MSPQRHRSDHSVFGQPSDVSPWEVRFDPEDVAHLERSGAGLRFRIWAETGLEQATVVTRHGGAIESWPMERVGSGGAASLWEALVDRPDGTEFSFAFVSRFDRPVYVSPTGISNAIERLDRWVIEPGAGVGPDVPDWARGAVIYQIFPDRFANGDRSNDPPAVRPWGVPPDHTGFYGGDLDGITARLDYLADLGGDAIYLNPIFASPSNHRYDTVDYYSVDQLLGGNEALRGLVAAAHARDIRVILDASFNHTHPQFFAFADLIERGPDSEYAGWFVVDEWPIHVKYRPEVVRTAGLEAWFDRWRAEVGVDLVEVGGDGPAFEPSYQAWYGVPTMPRVDLHHPDARRYMLDVAAHWISEHDVDGWRMDVTRYVDPDFWDEFRAVVRAVKPDAYLLAEVFGDASQWLQGGRFDATMNYTFRDLLLHFLAARDADGPWFLEQLTRLWGLYGESVSLVNHNAVSTHDVPRFLTLAGGEVDSLRLAAACQMLFPGAPGIYYGDEVGVDGGEDPECRATFPWDGDPTGHPVHRLIRDLAKLRREHPVLRRGRFRPLSATQHAVAFERFDRSDRLVVAINRGRRRARFGIPVSEVLWASGKPGPRLEVDGPGVVVARLA